MRGYIQELNGNVVKDVNYLSEKIEKETNPEELLRLRMQRLYRGMELSSSIYQRNPRTFYPY